jgi:catechol 2,3-dioxygenase-like lactoylglutathione lyase family enzyme
VGAGGFETLGAIQTATDPPVEGLRVVYVRDPDGVTLELIEEPPNTSLETLYFPSG